MCHFSFLTKFHQLQFIMIAWNIAKQRRIVEITQFLQFHDPVDERSWLVAERRRRQCRNEFVVAQASVPASPPAILVSFGLTSKAPFRYEETFLGHEGETAYWPARTAMVSEFLVDLTSTTQHVYFISVKVLGNPGYRPRVIFAVCTEVSPYKFMSKEFSTADGQPRELRRTMVDQTSWLVINDCLLRRELRLM